MTYITRPHDQDLLFNLIQRQRRAALLNLVAYQGNEAMRFWIMDLITCRLPTAKGGRTNRVGRLGNRGKNGYVRVLVWIYIYNTEKYSVVSLEDQDAGFSPTKKILIVWLHIPPNPSSYEYDLDPTSFSHSCHSSGPVTALMTRSSPVLILTAL